MNLFYHTFEIHISCCYLSSLTSDTKFIININYYRPQTKFAKVMFLQASVILLTGGGMRGFIWGGVCVWFYLGGMHGFIRGVCVVLFGGACVVLFGGACVVLFGGACVVLLGGRAWFYSGGVHGFIWGGMHGFIWGGMRGFSSFFGYNEIRSMSGRYASYWNAFLFYTGGRNTVTMEGKPGQLTRKQIVRLAAAISADNMVAIAEGYMDIDDATIKNLQYENKDNAQAFNREIIRHWANRHPENQLEVCETRHEIYRVDDSS